MALLYKIYNSHLVKPTFFRTAQRSTGVPRGRQPLPSLEPLRPQTTSGEALLAALPPQASLLASTERVGYLKFGPNKKYPKVETWPPKKKHDTNDTTGSLA